MEKCRTGYAAGQRAGVRSFAVLLAGLAVCGVAAHAQLCTTQSRMAPALRDTLAQRALELGSAIQASDTKIVRDLSISSLSGNFAATEALLRSIGGELGGDTLRVTQLYLLDASSRTPGASGAADFTCPLTGVASETDFSINGLPPGRFAFAMVEAEHGPHPWLLAFLLEQDGPATSGAWKMAGFYPHARTAAGHDGLWYWTDARAKVAAKEPWLAWLEYGEADSLLRPANFVSTPHLDELRTEQHTAAPAGLADGVTQDAPLLLKAADGAEFRVTELNTESQGGDGPLQLDLHVQAQGSTDVAAMQARGSAAASALLSAHPELRPAFTGVLVVVEAASGTPVVVSMPVSAVR